MFLCRHYERGFGVNGDAADALWAHECRTQPMSGLLGNFTVHLSVVQFVKRQDVPECRVSLKSVHQ